jgi:hypothetical protein
MANESNDLILVGYFLCDINNAKLMVCVYNYLEPSWNENRLHPIVGY